MKSKIIVLEVLTFFVISFAVPPRYNNNNNDDNKPQYKKCVIEWHSFSKTPLIQTYLTQNKCRSSS